MMQKFPPFKPIPNPKVAHGRGSWITDQDGNQVIDGSGGPAVCLCCVISGLTKIEHLQANVKAENWMLMAVVTAIIDRQSSFF